MSALNGLQTIRYQASNDWSGTITKGDLTELIVCTTSGTTNYRLMDSIRLKRIEMWGPASQASGTSPFITKMISIADESTGSVGGPTRTLSDFSLSNARPSHLVWKPAKGSMQSLWITTGIASTDAILSLVVSSGTVVDVTFEYIIGDGTDAPVLATASGAGGTAGQVYFKRFGVTATSTLVPQAVQYLA